jgi:hypothetical protein
MSTTGENNKGAGVQGSLPKKAAAEPSGGSSAPAPADAAVAAANVDTDNNTTNPIDATTTTTTIPIPTVKIDPITALQDDIGTYGCTRYNIHAHEHSYRLLNNRPYAQNSHTLSYTACIDCIINQTVYRWPCLKDCEDSATP